MSGVKHTPGPWRISTDNATVGPEDGFAPFGACGCCNSPWMMADDDQTALADARLIAAAPDLLEALVMMADAVDPLVSAPPIVGPITQRVRTALVEARSAIARARGEQDGGGE